jgi:hypothetical protein
MKGYKMNQAINFNTLTWVKNELDQTLREARQSLEAHVEIPEDGAQLELLAGHLHQVFGTLQMVELYGASLLAEEMECVARAIAGNTVSQHDDACEVLMRAILQLPDYLDRLIAGHRDIPLVLLPILNDLRAVRGENLLSENAMFSPNLDALLPETIVGKAVAGERPYIRPAVTTRTEDTRRWAFLALKQLLMNARLYIFCSRRKTLFGAELFTLQQASHHGHVRIVAPLFYLAIVHFKYTEQR